jgi:hypothetical protein
MTHQGGPDMPHPHDVPRDPPDVPRDPNVRRAQDYIRRDDGSWSFVPIAIGLALMLGLGYLVFGAGRTSTDSPTYRATERIEKPDTPPASKPAPTTPPAPDKQP